ncbi:MAG: LPS export ABC transporter permease LptG [Alphaproteobacteria bacterium]
MTTLSRYIAWRIFRGIFLAFIIVTGIIMLVDFVEASRNIGADADLSAITVMFLTLLKAPQLIEQTIPFVVLFGVMGALYSLNHRSELTVMRASGLSAWRFLRPAIAVTGILGIIWALAFNPLASKAMETHGLMMAAFTQKGPVQTKQKEIWLREGTQFEQTVIYAASADLFERTLYDVTFTMFDADSDGELVFTRRFDAKKAELLSSQYWQLTDVIENTNDAVMRRNSTTSWPTTITVKQLQDHNKSESLPAFWQLPSEIKKVSQAGFSSVRLQMQFNKLLSLPLTLIAMTIIAAGVSMHLTRQGGTLRLMLLGGVLGFAVYFTDNMIGAFGQAGTIPIPLAVWAIPFFVLFCGLAYLSRIEDG